MQAGASPLIGVLNEIVATEIVCYLRYSQHAIAATGLDHAQVAAAFEEHADEDLQHGMWAAERVSRLGRDPDTERTWFAERIAITTYEIGRWMDGPLGYLTGCPLGPAHLPRAVRGSGVVVQQAFTARSAWQAELDAGSCCCRCGFPEADPI
jgi:hypothetical protein